ncbi:MAG: dTDP-4-dehydrorhamnose reductase [Betaproteobacteria bacterium]|nr:MAG: dTDP-4-dehydrorhamnose reductase [Betaproteobacteria bacterium]
MRVLLAGRNGQVGWELARLLPPAELIATGRAELDLADQAAIRRVVREAKPQLIVNAAAYTAVDKAEAQPDLAMRINGIAPGVLAEEAKRLGALLVHYSTDYVFDGTKSTAYTEDDAPNPHSVYGRSKLAGERAVQASGCRHLILRTSWVYGPRGKNFFLTIAAKARAGERLRVVDDQRGVPTTSAFLAERTLALIARDASGLLHLVPAGETTWYGFAREIVQLIGARSEVQPIKTGEFPAAARRPANSVLDNRRAAAILGEPPHWRELLDDVRKSAGL